MKPKTEYTLPALSRADVTPLERATVRMLRSETGWWVGDEAALEVLRDYTAIARKTQPLKSPLEFACRLAAVIVGPVALALVLALVVALLWLLTQN